MHHKRSEKYEFILYKYSFQVYIYLNNMSPSKILKTKQSLKTKIRVHQFVILILFKSYLEFHRHN